jgi:uncharacterized membrane protein YkgB
LAVIEASGHCGAMRIKVAERPRQLMSCSCSICRRLGTLWAYYRPDQVTFVAAMSSLTYIRTWTFFASTPGVAAPAAGGFPVISGDVGQFLLKDLVLLAASLCLLLNSLGMTSRRA